MTDGKGVQLRFGDVVRWQDMRGSRDAVVIELESSIQAISIVKDGDTERLGMAIGSVGGVVEVVGSWAVGRVIQGVQAVFGPSETIVQQLTAQSQLPAVSYLPQD